MKNNFWQDLPKPFFALAPMEGITDTVFRQVIMQASKPDVFFTEFVNASSFCSEKGQKSTRGRLNFVTQERPVVAQIWGNKPGEFAKMSAELSKQGFAGIDINMGCPDKNVVKAKSGAYLIKTPDVACQLIKNAKSGGLPVSVKTRLGYSNTEEFLEWIPLLLKQDLANLTIHLRTKKEMSKVEAHWELIPEIKKIRDEIAPQTFLTINGDIKDRNQGRLLAKKYKIDGIMIGRGVFENPYTFSQDSHQPTKEELLKLLNLHLDLHDKYNKVEPRKFDPLKRFFKIYIRDFAGASELRNKLMQTTCTNEVRTELRRYI